MKSEEVCLVMTGCIAPSIKVCQLCVKEEIFRYNQYIKSMNYYIENTKVKNIVFCDNSGGPIDPTIYSLAEKNNKNFEWLSFIGDQGRTEEQGKGYGEGEILSYVIQNSKLLARSSYIAKVTGQLKIRNIDLIIKLLRESDYFFNSYRDEKNQFFIDTRFYVAKTNKYRVDMLDAYEYVDDKAGYYLEHSVAQKILERNLRFRNFPLDINIDGVSGTTGYNYSVETKTVIWRSLPIITRYILNQKPICKPVSELGRDLVWGDYMWFQNFSMLEGSRVIIYGAGKIGEKFYLLARGHCQVAAWVDKDYRKKRKWKGIRVLPPGQIKTTKFDYIVIAVKDTRIVEEIKQYILSMGILEEKIMTGIPKSNNVS